jgi:hypothetical protein
MYVRWMYNVRETVLDTLVVVVVFVVVDVVYAHISYITGGW